MFRPRESIEASDPPHTAEDDAASAAHIIQLRQRGDTTEVYSTTKTIVLLRKADQRNKIREGFAEYTNL